MGRNDRNRRHGNHKNWNNSGNKDNQRNLNPPVRGHFNPENAKEAQEREIAIREFKKREVICPSCGQPIVEMSTAIADKDSGSPMHFDCVLAKVSEGKKLLPNQSMTYIGNGRFAVVTFENPRDTRKFKIEEIIEWEDRNKPNEWQGEMANLFSQVK